MALGFKMWVWTFWYFVSPAFQGPKTHCSLTGCAHHVPNSGNRKQSRHIGFLVSWETLHKNLLQALWFVTKARMPHTSQWRLLEANGSCRSYHLQCSDWKNTGLGATPESWPNRLHNDSKPKWVLRFETAVGSVRSFNPTLYPTKEKTIVQDSLWSLYTGW